jgi:hypothetical protein
MQSLGDVIDKAHAQQNELFRRQKEQEAVKLNAIVSRTAEKAKASVTAADRYLAAVKAEMAGLKEDISSVALTSSSGAVAMPIAENEETQYKGIMQCATTGQWGNAMLKATNAGSLPLLMRFLETEVVKQNRSTIASAKVMTFPVFMSLAQQLSANLTESVGLIPQRIDWLNEVVVAFDSYLAQPSPVDKAAIINAQADFSNIVDQLETVDVKTAGIDRTTKRCLVLVKKALSAYGL